MRLPDECQGAFSLRSTHQGLTLQSILTHLEQESFLPPMKTLQGKKMSFLVCVQPKYLRKALKELPGDMDIAPLFQSHVYQVTPTLANCATSSLRSPAVLRRTPGSQKVC